MALALEQYFLTGRFHATRWNQNPFEDAHGEWPPAPYRLLRTLAARWFEHSRETGDTNSAGRDRLLQCLASVAPAFSLPENATHTSRWPSRGLKQYQPMELVKSDKKKGESWVKRHQTSLVVDSFAMLPSSQPVVWIWPNVNLPDEESVLLDQLLRRITYFGRAESLCLMRRAAGALPEPNCSLQSEADGGNPVLVAEPGAPLNFDILYANNEDSALAGWRIPPGTRWMYARRPVPQRLVLPSRTRPVPSLQMIQFAVGGRVFPPPNAWTRLTERFRGIVLRQIAYRLTRDPKARFADLSPEELERFSLMTGKSSDETQRTGHQHAAFWLLPDQNDQPTRLVCYRSQPFSEIEYHALQAASEAPLAWEFGNPDWLVRLVPLPPETPLPHPVCAAAATWRSLTPYVPARHVLGRNGKPKAGASIAQQIANELTDAHLPAAEITVDEKMSAWVKIHVPKRQRSAQSNAMKRAYCVTLDFERPVPGPISLGNSSHFGLGLFVPDA